jgi:ABC-type uncharacterized transport system substrate-binding protein
LDPAVTVEAVLKRMGILAFIGIDPRAALRRLLAYALGLALLLAAGAVQAHPHVFIDNHLVFVFDGAALTGFREVWVFDDIFSQQLLDQFDSDRDGHFTDAESASVANGTLPNLAHFHYFTYVWLGGKPLPAIAPSDFHAFAESGIVAFDFMVKLPRPIDPRRVKFALEANDRSYYVQVALAAQKRFTIAGMKDITCEPHVDQDLANAYYGGFVYPERVTLACN